MLLLIFAIVNFFMFHKYFALLFVCLVENSNK